MQRGTNLPAVGGYNQTVVLEVIRRGTGAVSRKEISESSGLALQTVRNAVEKLVSDGLVVFAGKRIRGPGKPEELFDLAPEGRYALGVHLDPTFMVYVMLDLRGRVVAETVAHMPPDGDPDDVILEIGAALDDLVAASGVDRDRIIGIGIATPGPLDLVNGIILNPPLLERWRNVPIRAALSAATGRPVILESGPSAAAVAEHWLQSNVEHHDFAFFYFGSGIGLGLVLDGQLRRGASGNAGSGGTLFVPVAGLTDGRHVDMLGRLATAQYMVEQAVAVGLIEAPSPHNDTSAIEKRFEELLALDAAGDANAAIILERAAGLIGAALVSMINFIDLEEIIFGGPYWGKVAERFTPIISQVVNHSADRETEHAIRMSTSTVHGDVVAVGAASLVLDDTLAPRASDLLITS